MSTSPNREFIEQWKHSLAPYNLGYKLKLASQLMYRDFLERLEPYSLTPFHYCLLLLAFPSSSLGVDEKPK